MRVLRSLAVISALLLSGAPALSSAATYVVNATDDGSLSALGVACPSGALTRCTLRGAIEATEANGESANTIQLQVEGVAVQSALPTITKSLSITGSLGSGAPTHIARLASVARGSSDQYCYGISNAGTVYPLFSVDASGSSSINVSFENILACFGDARTTAKNGAGGAIRFTGSQPSVLNLVNVRLVNNLADIGGALSVDGAAHQAYISGSSFSGNIATSSGGAAYFQNGKAEIRASTIGPYFATGAVAADAAAPRLPFSADGNTAGSFGGGLWVDAASLSLIRSFVVANTAPVGSALVLVASSGTTPPATLIGNTIARNQISGSGSGTAIYAATATLPATATAPFVGNIVADNSGNGCALIIGNTVADTGGYNLFGDGSCTAGGTTPVLPENLYRPSATTFWNIAAGHVTSGGVGGFASRGLAPSVLPIVAESPAVDFVKSSHQLKDANKADARGAAVVDGNGDGVAVADIGAYEFGGYGLVGFVPQSSSGYSIAEPASGNASLPLPIKNFVGTATTSALRVSSIDASLAALPSSFSPGSASPDLAGKLNDYAPLSSAIASPLAVGASDNTAKLLVHADSLSEADESVRLLLSGLVNVDADVQPSGSSTPFCLDASAGGYYPCATQTATITGDLPSGFLFQKSSVAVPEAGGTFGLTVVRTGDLSTASTVTCSASSGSAIKNRDFVVSDQVLSFAANESSKLCVVSVLQDAVVESTETFTVNLSAPSKGSILTPGSETVGIIDDDSADTVLSLSQASYSVNEAAGSLTVTVTRGGDSSAAVEVTLATQDGTAVDKIDYTATSATLKWDAGASGSQTVNIPILQNSVKDGSRQFSVLLGGAKNDTDGSSKKVALASPDSATVTIVDDDASTAGITLSTSSVAIVGTGSSVYSITLSQVPSADVLIALSSSDSSVVATSADNGTATLKFPAGSTTLTRSVNVKSSANPASGSTLTAQISHSVTSSDLRYGAATVAKVTVTVGSTNSVPPSSGSTGGGGGGALGWPSLLVLAGGLLLRRRRRG